MKFCRQSKIHNVNKYTIITFYTNREKTWDRIRDNEQKSDKNSNPNERKKKVAMNGEMHQICCIVAAGKRALQYGEPIQIYTGAIRKCNHLFMPTRKTLFGDKKMHRTENRNVVWVPPEQRTARYRIGLSDWRNGQDDTRFFEHDGKLGSLLLSKRRNILFRPKLAVRSRKATMEHRVFGISLSRFSIGKTPFRKQHRLFSTSVVRYRKIGYSNPVWRFCPYFPFCEKSSGRYRRISG